MAHVISRDTAEPVVRALLGAIDTGDGGTPEPRSVIAAFATGYWGRDDLDVDTLDPLSPADAAAQITDPAARRRARELLVLTELCRHPLTEEQVERTDEYAAALGESGPGLELSREQEEISVNAMQVAVNDSDAHWIQLLGSLAIHEAGYLPNGDEPIVGTLARDGAPAMLAEALRRGSECTGDDTQADHLALAAEPLEAVRARFGIPARQH